jgi:hypothetical protein
MKSIMLMTMFIPNASISGENIVKKIRLWRYVIETCETYSVIGAVDLRRARRFLVRIIFSSASAAFSRTPWTTSSGAFSTNYREQIEIVRHAHVNKERYHNGWFCSMKWFLPQMPPYHGIVKLFVVHHEDGDRFS